LTLLQQLSKGLQGVSSISHDRCPPPPYNSAKLNIKKDSELPETDHHNRKTLFSSVLYAHNASFPPLARSPPHPDAILIGCILAHLLPVIGFLVAHPCLSPGGHLSLCSAGTKQKTWIILPWTACACIRPPAPHFHADFFFSRSIKHPQAIVFVQFVRRPIMCSYEP